MNRGVLRSTLAWAALAVLGCSASGSGCGGCAESIPGGFPPDQRVNNAISAKVTANGLHFFESRVNDIIGVVAASGLDFNVPCTDATQSFTIPVIGNTVTVPVYACDHTGDLACTSADLTAPVADAQQPTTPPLHACEARAAVKTLKISPTQASPSSPVQVAVDIEVRVNTGTIPVATHIWGCGDIKCNIEYDSNQAAPADIPFKVPLNLTLDPAYGDILAFTVGTIDVSQVFEPADLQVASAPGSGFCSLGCDVVNIDFVKDQLLNFLKGTINTKIRDAVDKFRCRACDAVTHNCPGNSQCVVAQGVCYVCDPASPAGTCTPQYKPDSDPARDKRICPPALLGLEGRVGVGGFLASFGGPPDSLLDLYAVAGGKNTDSTPSAKVESGGIVLGVMGGTRSAVRDADGNVKAPGVAACVPTRQWATRPQPDSFSFDTEAAAASAPGTGSIADYQLGLSLSDNFLDKTLFDAFQSGLLCLNVDAKVSTFLSSSLFRTFLPSLGKLTDGQDVPMMIALRPKDAPQIIIGKGTTKKVNGEEVPDDPLITIVMKNVSIDFYAFIEERYSRLFSLKTDINLPLSLKFDAARNTVQPVLASLQTVVSNIDAQNSEMLAENPQIVADLLDAIIGLVQPILASVLAPIELPTVNGFKLSIRDARGVVKYAAPAPGYEHLALFANLELQAAPDRVLVDTAATLADGYVPRLAELAGPTHVRPFATLDVQGLGLRHLGFKGYEFSFRVDGGLWSPWTERTRIEVHAPVLLFQGRHGIEVVAREIGEAVSEDATPAMVPFVVDYEAPKVALVLDPETRAVRTDARDAVSRDDELTFRYRVGGADWTAADGPRVFGLAQLGREPSLEVEVTDAAGHAGTAVFGTPADQLGDGGARPPAPAAGGCSEAGIPALALAGLAAFAARRRRTA